MEPKALGQLGSDRDLVSRWAGRQGAGLETELAVERIGAVDPFQLDEDAVGAVGPGRHSAHAGAVADLALRAKAGEPLGRGGPLDHHDLDIAAPNGSARGRERVGQSEEIWGG